MTVFGAVSYHFAQNFKCLRQKVGKRRDQASSELVTQGGKYLAIFRTKFALIITLLSKVLNENVSEMTSTALLPLLLSSKFFMTLECHLSRYW